MASDEVSNPYPIRVDADGVPRVGSSRVRLANVVHYYQQGATPGEIQERLPSLPLADIYAVIAFYLRHRAELDSYLVHQATEAERVRMEADSRPGTKALRKKLLDHRNRARSSPSFS